MVSLVELLMLQCRVAETRAVDEGTCDGQMTGKLSSGGLPLANQLRRSCSTRGKAILITASDRDMGTWETPKFRADG